jgi:RNA polymerase sigma-32 factor
MNYVSREPVLCNSKIPPDLITADCGQFDGTPAGHLTRAKERELIARWQKNGDGQARNELIIAFQDLVRGAAAASGLIGPNFEDAVSQGNLGLLRAADKFDLSRGTRFATYADQWVWSFIRDGRRNSLSVVRRPRGVVSSSDDSLSAPVKLKDDSTIDPQELYCDEDTFDELDQYDGRRQILSESLSTLTDRERRILEARQLSDEPPTLQELGDEFKVTRERARQIEAGALEKVRRAATSANIGELARGLAMDAFSGRGNKLSRSHLIERRHIPAERKENYRTSKEARRWVLECRP